MARKRLLSAEGSLDPSHSGRLMGVIIDSEEEQVKKAFFELQKNLGIAEGNMFFLLCARKRPENDIFNIPHLSEDDLSWNGSLKNDEVRTFFNKRFDVLVSFTATENKLAAFAVSIVRADLKVGRESSLKNGLDLVISTKPDEPAVFTAELEKYLKILKTAV